MKYMKNSYKYIIPVLVALFSCQKEKEPPQYNKAETESPCLYASTRAEEINDDVEIGNNPVTDCLNEDFVSGYSLIYISQRGGNNQDPDFMNETSDNFYTYLYYENPEANWEAGYNFEPYGKKELDWNKIRDLGMLGNSYIFYSIYSPEDNKIRFEVEQDQSDLSNLRKSNILGARHTTAELNSRLRFRFYHLMVFLNVNLYVPVYDKETNSGFLENALVEGRAISINRHFSIDYASDPGADASPTVGLSGTDSEEVRMYIHPGSEEMQINVPDYYPAVEGTDRVRKYTLSVIFPAGQDVTNKDVLRFLLNTPGGTNKKYIFSTNQNIQLHLQKGSVTQLGLYLPRNDNNTILISAEIEDWKKCSSEMNMVEE